MKQTLYMLSFWYNCSIFQRNILRDAFQCAGNRAWIHMQTPIIQNRLNIHFVFVSNMQYNYINSIFFDNIHVVVVAFLPMPVYMCETKRTQRHATRIWKRSAIIIIIVVGSEHEHNRKLFSHIVVCRTNRLSVAKTVRRLNNIAI